MTSLPWFLEVLVGSGMGFCAGLFGLGGSSIGTPILRLLGLPALIALASPLPLTLPSAILHRRGCANGGAIAYQKDRVIHWRIAVLTSLWGMPWSTYWSLAHSIYPRNYSDVVNGTVYSRRGSLWVK